MKGKQTFIILSAMEHGPTGTDGLLKKLFAPDESYGKAFRKRISQSDRATATRTMRVRYHNLLYKLRTAGLITEHRLSEGRSFSISKRGKEKLVELRERSLLPSVKDYKKEVGIASIIVTFDIPETERPKRDWLRKVLLHLGLKKIQDSVWMGTTKLPLALLSDLDRLHIRKHVEMFQLTKTGIVERS